MAEGPGGQSSFTGLRVLENQENQLETLVVHDKSFLDTQSPCCKKGIPVGDRLKERREDRGGAEMICGAIPKGEMKIKQFHLAFDSFYDHE